MSESTEPVGEGLSVKLTRSVRICQTNLILTYQINAYQRFLRFLLAVLLKRKVYTYLFKHSGKQQ